MNVPARTPAHRGAGLAGRLLVAQTLVLLTGGPTAWLIAAAVGPSLFHEYLARANVGSTPAQILHTQMAYRSANAISPSWALLAALAVAMAVNVHISRRIGRSVAIIVPPDISIPAISARTPAVLAAVRELCDTTATGTTAARTTVAADAS